MEEVKKFEELVEDLKKDLITIMAAPKTREILDLIVETHNRICDEAKKYIKEVEENRDYYYGKYYDLDHKNSKLCKKLDLQHEIITQLLCEKYQISQREEDTIPF